MKNIKYYLIVLFSSWPLFSRAALLNDNVMNDAQDFAGKSGYDTTNNPNIYVIIGSVLQYLLGFVGMIFLILVITGGLQWMTAGGNADKITKARTRMINAATGLFITIAAYAITWFIQDVAFSVLRRTS